MTNLQSHNCPSSPATHVRTLRHVLPLILVCDHHPEHGSRHIQRGGATRATCCVTVLKHRSGGNTATPSGGKTLIRPERYNDVHSFI